MAVTFLAYLGLTRLYLFIVLLLLTVGRSHNITHILNVAAGLEVTREDLNFVEEKIELLDVPEQDIKEGWVKPAVS